MENSEIIRLQAHLKTIEQYHPFPTTGAKRTLARIKDLEQQILYEASLKSPLTKRRAK